jgi:uncharacterized iron-regulated protein
VALAEETSIDAFVATARGADVVVIGEVHDNPGHHENQAEIVRKLKPDALVFEMIQQADEGKVNELRAEGATGQTIAEAIDWAGSGWPDFDFYAPILEAAPEARIFGAGQPRDDVRRAVEEGAAAVFGPDAAKYRLAEPLSEEEQAARVAEMSAAHCGRLPGDMVPSMIEAQRFRDAGLADAALWARTITGPEAKVVVIAGTGHADLQTGVPAMIAIAEPEVRVLSLGQFEADPGRAGAFDAYMLAPSPERDDPCEGLPKG